MDNKILPNVAVYPADKKEYKPLERTDFVFLVLYLLSSYLLIAMGLFGGFKLGFTISYIVLFLVSTAYTVGRGNRPGVFSVLCGLLSLAGSVTFALFDDWLINFIMIILIVGLHTVYSIGLSNGFTHNPGSFRMLLDMAKDVVVYPFTRMEYIIGGIKASSIRSKRSVSSIIGVVLALPVIAVLVALLMHSDAAFEGLVKTVGKNTATFFLYLVPAVAITPYFFSRSYAKRNSLAPNISGVGHRGKLVPVSACVSFLGAISVVYVVYLLSQLAYFFSAFKGILPPDYKYTASAFARRGFFEMFAICAINILLVSVVVAVSKKKSLALKLISCFISLFSVLLIVTAMQKMKLNISIYGMSKNRVLVSVFMLMMLVVIIFFILHIFAPKISYMQPIIIVCSTMFIALSFADIDARIAKYNIDAYNSGSISTLDVESIGNLSDSAAPYLEQLVDSDDRDISHRAITILASKLANDNTDYLDGKKTGFMDGVRSYNRANMNAILTFDDSKYSKEIYDIAKLYRDDECYYDAEHDYFERYLDNGDYIDYYYNPDTHLYDKSTRYDSQGNPIKAR